MTSGDYLEYMFYEHEDEIQALEEKVKKLEKKIKKLEKGKKSKKGKNDERHCLYGQSRRG